MTATYDELRERYRPDDLRLLLIGESPPDPGEGPLRFFYGPAVHPDNLYRSVALALYDEPVRLDAESKAKNLDRLKADGVWLIDATDTPINKLTVGRRGAIRTGVPALVERCQALAPKIGVAICHTLVFKEAAGPLRDAGVPLLHDDRLPFPDNVWREEFVAGLRTALDGVGWTTP